MTDCRESDKGVDQMLVSAKCEIYSFRGSDGTNLCISCITPSLFAQLVSHEALSRRQADCAKAREPRAPCGQKSGTHLQCPN